MTPEFGAASQLEKIDMLDFADVVAINKFERRGAEDALRDVGRQLVRNREAFGKQPDDMPVFGTCAATFNDDGVTALYQHLRGLLAEHGLHPRRGHARPRRRPALVDDPRRSCPADRVRYLAEIAETVRGYHARTDVLVEQARRVQRLELVADELDGRRARQLPRADAGRRSSRGTAARRATRRDAARAVAVGRARSTPSTPAASRCPATGSPASRCPAYADHGELVRFWRRENLPGRFPFTAGVFPFKRDERGPGPDVRRRGRPVPHQPPLQAAVRGPARDPAVARRSTRSRSTAATPTSAPTSTARSARPASASRRSTT